MKRPQLPDSGPLETSVARFAQISEQAAARAKSPEDLIALRDTVRTTRAQIRSAFESAELEVQRRIAEAEATASPARRENA
jgi:hypothetical protein